MSETPTPRELEALRAYLEAGSVKGAAHRLGTTEASVKKILMHARVRIGARTTAELVFRLYAELAA